MIEIFQDYDGKELPKIIFYERLKIDMLIFGDAYYERIFKGDTIICQLIDPIKVMVRY